MGCWWCQTCPHPPIPFRRKNKALDYSVDEEKNIKLNSTEIRELMSLGYFFGKVRNGVVAEGPQDHTFQTPIRQLFEMKEQAKREKNKILTEAVKRVLNSIYGKTCEKDHTSSFHIFTRELCGGRHILWVGSPCLLQLWHVLMK